jgi:hypothetical protein
MLDVGRSVDHFLIGDKTLCALQRRWTTHPTSICWALEALYLEIK